MKKLLFAALLPLLTLSCDNTDIPTESCLTSAEVVDMSGLDGCGYMFKLNNGKYLEPVRDLVWYGTGSSQEKIEKDPLQDFEFHDGLKVKIGYEPATNYGSICMAGEMVFITCIEIVNAESDTTDDY